MRKKKPKAPPPVAGPPLPWFLVYQSAELIRGDLSGARLIQAEDERDAAKRVLTMHMVGVSVAALARRPLWFAVEPMLQAPVNVKMPGDKE